MGSGLPAPVQTAAITCLLPCVDSREALCASGDSLRCLGATASEGPSPQAFVMPFQQLERLSVDVEGLAWTVAPEGSLHLPYLCSLSGAPDGNSCASLMAANTRLRAVCLSPALQQHEAGLRCGQTVVP